MQCTVTRPHLQNHRYRFLLTFIRAHQQMNTLNPNQLPHPPPSRYCLVCILHCQLKSKRRHMKEERERKGGGEKKEKRGESEGKRERREIAIEKIAVPHHVEICYLHISCRYHLGGFQLQAPAVGPSLPDLFMFPGASAGLEDGQFKTHVKVQAILPGCQRRGHWGLPVAGNVPFSQDESQ